MPLNLDLARVTHETEGQHPFTPSDWRCWGLS
jgi:hypothetical protein